MIKFLVNRQIYGPKFYFRACCWLIVHCSYALYQVEKLEASSTSTTSYKIENLRKILTREKADVYIIPSEDAHWVVNVGSTFQFSVFR